MIARQNDLIGLNFLRLGIVSLAIGMFFGVIGGFQFLFPDFLQELLFNRTRPIHVSMVVSWIFLAAIGGIYFYLPRQQKYSMVAQRGQNSLLGVYRYGYCDLV